MVANVHNDISIIPPVVTVFGNKKNRGYRVVCEESQKRALEYVLCYCDGVLLGGTTGLGAALTYNQFKSLLKIVSGIRNIKRKDKQILVAAIEASASRVKEKIYKAVQIERTIGFAIDGFVVAPQAFFYRKSKRECHRSMEEIADFAFDFNKAIILYNIPRSGMILNFEDICQMKKINNIRGIKDSTGNYELFTKILELKDDNFSVYQGKPEFDLYAMKDGTNGLIDANANFAPSLIKEMVGHFINNDHQNASLIHQRIMDSTNFLNHTDDGFEENRLGSRIDQLYLLGVIDTLPCPMTERELKSIGRGLIKNEIPKAEEITSGIKAGKSFSEADLKHRINQLDELGYQKDIEGRFTFNRLYLD